jgi:protein-tyrosine phosphatase
VIDFHSHLMPGVDDGAASLDDSRAALAAMREQGVTALVTTPHFRASQLERADECAEYLGRLDEAWASLKALASAEFPDLRVERGVELMLDTPLADLSDPRLRLAGTSFVLVEFPFMTVPPNAGQAIFELKMSGWTPIIAHPERYSNLQPGSEAPGEWRRVGAYLQVNGASLLGRYGPQAQQIAGDLLKRGWADYLSSDYHARGRLHSADVRAHVARQGEPQAALLTEINPSRMLTGDAPMPVPPLAGSPSLLRRIFGRG